MSEPARRVLYLLVAGLPETQRPDVSVAEKSEVFDLNETNGAEALARIFEADAVSVWGAVE